jgi:hypothetical protein
MMRDGGGSHFPHGHDLAAIHLHLRGDGFKDLEARLIGKGFRYFLDLGSIHKQTLSLAKQPALRPPVTSLFSHETGIDATKYLDIHLNVETSKTGLAARVF